MLYLYLDMPQNKFGDYVGGRVFLLLIFTALSVFFDFTVDFEFLIQSLLKVVVSVDDI